MLLVPVSVCSIAEKKAALTHYIRTTLRMTGVSREDFEKAVAPDKKTDGGAGCALLCKHYEFALQTSCGVDLDSGIGCYLRAMRIHDTTTDYYLCLSDETGNHRLQTIMDRAQCGTGVQEKEYLPPISSKLLKDDSIREYSVLPGGPEEKTAVVTKKRIFIPAGSDLTLMCKNGLTGTIKFSHDPKEILKCASQEIY